VERLGEDGVDVTNRGELKDKATGRLGWIDETHRMRYWFLPELRYLARQAGLTPVAEGVWMGEVAPDRSAWYVWMLVAV
jgi:hypothetical protein